MDSPRPARRIGPALWLSIALVVVLVAWSASCLLHAQVPADPAWRTCQAPSGQACLAVDVTTELAPDPVTGLPGKIQFLPNVNVTASWSGGWWRTTTKTLTTNSVGRVVFQVPLNKDISLKSDASGLLVSITNPTTGAPEGHHYLDKTGAIDQKNVYGNLRTMLTLQVNPQVAIK